MNNFLKLFSLVSVLAMGFATTVVAKGARGATSAASVSSFPVTNNTGRTITVSSDSASNISIQPGQTVQVSAVYVSSITPASGSGTKSVDSSNNVSIR